MAPNKWHYWEGIFRSIIRSDIDDVIDEDFVKRIEREPPRPVDSATDREVGEDLRHQDPDP